MSTKGLTPDQHADYEERAAILEYESNLSRAEAERQARQMVLTQQTRRA